MKSGIWKPEREHWAACQLHGKSREQQGCTDGKDGSNAAMHQNLSLCHCESQNSEANLIGLVSVLVDIDQTCHS